MTLAYNNKSTSGHGTDGQTDGRTECNAICGTLLRRAPHNKAPAVLVLCNVLMVTPPLATSVAETECISHHTGQTTGSGPLLSAAEIAYCHKTLQLFAGLCQLFKHCCVAAAKRYVQHSNLGR